LVNYWRLILSSRSQQCYECTIIAIFSLFHPERPFCCAHYDLISSSLIDCSKEIINQYSRRSKIGLIEETFGKVCMISLFLCADVRLQLKCDGTRWRTGREVKGKLANAVVSQYPSHFLGTRCIQHYYRWWRTPRLPAVDWTEASCRFKWTRPFRRKTKSGLYACAITFQLAFNL